MKAVILILVGATVVVLAGMGLINYSAYGAVIPTWEDRFISLYEREHGPVSDAREARLIAAVEYVCSTVSDGYDLIEAQEDLVLISGFTQAETYSIAAGAATFRCPLKSGPVPG